MLAKLAGIANAATLTANPCVTTIGNKELEPHPAIQSEIAGTQASRAKPQAVNNSVRVANVRNLSHTTAIKLRQLI